jgi:hypothetical protein
MENFGRLFVEQMVIAAARKAELGARRLACVVAANQGTALVVLHAAASCAAEAAGARKSPRPDHGWMSSPPMAARQREIP